MNKLEEKIYDSLKGEIPDYMFSYYDMDVVARIAAKIALELAEKAWITCCEGTGRDGEMYVIFEDFKKEIL